jgi:hypothetical protein
MTIQPPGGISREEAIANIVPGKILYLRAALPPQLFVLDKYFVVVGFDEWPLLLKINSERKLRQNQFLLKRSLYSQFLKYDSYLDCDRVWYVLSHDEIISQLMADPRKRIVGEILKDHEIIIVEKTKASRSVMPLHKAIIAKAFRAR